MYSLRCMENLFRYKTNTSFWSLYLLAFLVFFSPLSSMAQVFEDDNVLKCSPDNQTVEVGEVASFSVVALMNAPASDRFLIWYAPGGDPSADEGLGLDTFETVYSEPGDYTVTVFSKSFGNDPSNCHITVVEDVPPPPPVVDLCPNIDGNQTEVPEGMHVRKNGNCIDDSIFGPDQEILQCSPTNQIVIVGQPTSFSVTPLIGDQDNFYFWYAPGGNPSGEEGQSLDNFQTVYGAPGNYTVTVFKTWYGNDPDSCHVTVEEASPPPQTATISAKKIVCDSEADLPNWGAGGPDITSSTASTFLNTHPNCHLANWTFEWTPEGVYKPGDEDLSGGAGWTSFTSSATIPTGSRIWVREQFNDNYIPFV